MNYQCKKCGLGVIVIKEKIIRPCKCKAPIVATLSAVASGKGGIKI